MEIKGINKSNIYVEGKGVIKTSLSISNGLIKKIGNFKNKDYITIPSHLYVVPGFIDEHIHGANNVDTMDREDSSLRIISKSLVQEGVTSFCPTTMSMSTERICNSLENIYNSMNVVQGARILGAHIEGPFIAEKYKGAQGKEYIVPCDIDMVKKFIESSKGHITQMTFAYENNGKDILPLIKEHHIVASLGHTDANYKQTKEAFDNGVTCLTHFYNAMRGFSHRDIGVVGTTLLNPHVFVELIADLHHVSTGAIELLFKNHPIEKIILITDSTEAKYLPDGLYELGGQNVYSHDGIVTLADGTLAGSILRLDNALKNVRSVVNLPFEKLIDLVSKNPAQNLGLFDKYGSIKEHKCADFVVIDKNFNVYMTIVGGNIVYQSDEFKI